MHKKNINSYHSWPILDGLEMLRARSNTINFPKHKHDTFNISLVLDNTFSTELANKFLTAPMGTLAITNPGEIHATPCDSSTGVSFFTFYISPEVLKSINNGVSVYFEDRTVYDSPLFQKLHFLACNFQKKGIQFENCLYEAMEVLVAKYTTPQNFSLTKTHYFQRYLRELNLQEKFSLEKTAYRFGLDKYKFLRLFKQETGLTPTNYLLLKRVEKSRRLLKTEDDFLGIAVASGFYDVSHFHRNFVKFTGVTPKQYRSAIV